MNIVVDRTTAAKSITRNQKSSDQPMLSSSLPNGSRFYLEIIDDITIPEK